MRQQARDVVELVLERFADTDIEVEDYEDCLSEDGLTATPTDQEGVAVSVRCYRANAEAAEIVLRCCSIPIFRRSSSSSNPDTSVCTP